MTTKGKQNRNAKGTIDLRLSSFDNPVEHLTDVERRQVFQDVAKQHSQDYGTKLERIEQIIRSGRPLDILAHYAYYDLLLPVGIDADEKGYPYRFIALALDTEEMLTKPESESSLPTGPG